LDVGDVAAADGAASVSDHAELFGGLPEHGDGVGRHVAHPIAEGERAVGGHREIVGAVVLEHELTAHEAGDRPSNRVRRTGVGGRVRVFARAGVFALDAIDLFEQVESQDRRATCRAPPEKHDDRQEPAHP
jgi:hypothetical protein